MSKNGEVFQRFFDIFVPKLKLELMEEIWKDIENYEGYQVGNLGRIKNREGKIKTTYIQNKGYYCVSIYADGKTHHPTVHRLVAQAFIPNPNNYTQVNHIDCDKSNNTVSNLEWCNQNYNYREGKKFYLYSHNENHFYAKLRNTDIMIAELYKAGFTRASVARILGLNPSSLEAIENGISYRELGVDFKHISRTKYKDKNYIKIPSFVWEYFRDNTVLNTLIAQGKVSV